LKESNGRRGRPRMEPDTRGSGSKWRLDLNREKEENEAGFGLIWDRNRKVRWDSGWAAKVTSTGRTDRKSLFAPPIVLERYAGEACVVSIVLTDP